MRPEYQIVSYLILQGLLIRGASPLFQVLKETQPENNDFKLIYIDW
jgi:hypothetical protein